MSYQQNKRKHPRVRVGSVATHFRTADRNYLGVVENLSLGGLFIRTNNVLSSGTSVSLHLVRPGLKEAIALSGRVVNAVTLPLSAQRKCAPGIGIQFDLMSSELEARVCALLRSLEPMRSGRPTAMASRQEATVRAVQAPPSLVAVGVELPPLSVVRGAAHRPGPSAGRFPPPLLLPVSPGPLPPGISADGGTPAPTGGPALAAMHAHASVPGMESLQSLLREKEKVLERLQAENVRLRAELAHRTKVG